MLKHFINKNFSKNFYQSFVISIEETFFKDKKISSELLGSATQILHNILRIKGLFYNRFQVFASVDIEFYFIFYFSI
jgi:hypothetical protein